MIARSRVLALLALALVLCTARAQHSSSRSWQQQALQKARSRLRSLTAELDVAKKQAQCIRRRSNLLNVLHKRKRSTGCKKAPPKAAQLCAQLNALSRQLARAKRSCGNKWKPCWKRSVKPVANRVWKARQACACVQHARIVKQIWNTRRMCRQTRSGVAIARDIQKVKRRIRYLTRLLKPKPSVMPRPKW